MKNLSRVALAVIATTSILSPVVVPTAAAQSLSDEPASTESPTADVLESSSSEASSTEAPSTEKVPSTQTRDTKNCPYRTSPPSAVDTSENPAPGSSSPAPLPVPSTPAGGPRMAGCDLVLPNGFTAPEHVSASAWALVDVKTGDVIAAKDPHGRYRPASVIKVLLALVSLDELKLDQKITATYDDAAIEGSRAGLVEGNEYTVQLLLQGLLMNSGNDCGNALVRALGGQQTALRKINDKAKSLGATDTRVGNPTGLDAPGQSTSAFDLALFYAAAFNNQKFVDLAGTKLVTMPGDQKNDIPDFEMSNDNQLLASGYEGALGGKTGYTDDARHTFVGVAERDGRRLAAIVLDTIVVEKRAWQQAAELLDEGFTTAQGTKVGSLKDLPEQKNNALDDAKENLRELFGGDEASEPTAEDATNAENASNSGSSLITKDGIVGVGVALAAIVLIGVVMRVVVSDRKRKR